MNHRNRAAFRPAFRAAFRSGGALTFALALLLLTTPAFAVEQRQITQTFPVAENTTLQLANLAGRIELVSGSGNEAKVEATVFAEGRNASQTRELLDGMKWVETRDRKGNPEWALSYPVKDFRGFAYPEVGRDEDDSAILRLLASFNLGGSYNNGYLLGQRVAVYGSAGSSVPVLYADLKISLPGRGKITVRNLVGDVRGGDLAGNLTVDTGSGDVELGSFSGALVVDTGSGDVEIRLAKGETLVDTGSGSIQVFELIGNGTFDTGSGDIAIEKVAAGRVSLDTGSGDILVKGGTVGTLKGDTGSGDIEVVNVEIEVFEGDTGSGNVSLKSSLAQAREVRIDTGSGDVDITGGSGAAFDLEADLGSGEVTCHYADATLRKRGHEVVGAERGNRQTRIVVETGSGDCTIGPGA